MIPTDRSFSLAEQRLFSALSGDRNPIHLDPIGARRSMFGAPIVHGIHLLLWALSHLDSVGASRRVAGLQAVFQRPVRVDEPVTCVWSVTANGSRATVASRGRACARVDVTWISREVHSPMGVHETPVDSLPPVDEVVDIDLENMSDGRGQVGLFLDGRAIDALMPQGMSVLRPLDVAALLATTRVIGNLRPGLNSIYSSLTAEFGSPGGSSNLDHWVKSIDLRFKSAEIAFAGGGVEALATVFARPRPQGQLPYSEIVGAHGSEEFAGLVALVAGGSRGLGEVAAKLLCAGGAKVVLTYYKGALEADALVREMAELGADVSTQQLDVTCALPETLPTPDLLLYFSTPFIFGASKGQFDVDLFDQFCKTYVRGFHALCSRLLKDGGGRVLKVLYPSSSALAEIPANMGEYAAAKAAGEVLCAHLEGSHRSILIHRPRFPRLATDQTASVSPVNNGDPLPMLLAELRRLVAATRAAR